MLRAIPEVTEARLVRLPQSHAAAHSAPSA
jgi:hypothetical protein